jgi:hypothetical protein
LDDLAAASIEHGTHHEHAEMYASPAVIVGGIDSSCMTVTTSTSAGPG